MADDARRFAQLIDEKTQEYDFIVIDTPGADTPLSRQAHAAAATLVTPLNDSFVDFDLLARIDPESFEVKAPSLYADFVWDAARSG